jgi:hypothetical protein
MKLHMQEVHNLRDSAIYHVTRTAHQILYECQVCDKQVSWNKSSIEEHVKTHFLDLERYAKLYVFPFAKLHQQAAKSSCVDERTTRLPDEEQQSAIAESHARYSGPSELMELQDPDSCRTSSAIAAVAASSAMEHGSVCYLCPLGDNCSALFTKQDLKDGTASDHCASRHQMLAWQFRKMGLRFVKVVRERGEKIEELARGEMMGEENEEED